MRTIIFKAVEKCNSNCVYCDVIKKRLNNIMDIDLLQMIFFRINEFLKENPYEQIEFLWHGGEIGLLGASYFDTALKIQEKICHETQNRICHAVQSNLTIMTQEILDSLKRLGIRSIGTSYDLVPQIRGIGNKRDSDKYNALFLKGVDLLRKNNMPSGIIYVVHKKSLSMPEQILHHISNIVYDGSCKFNPIHIYGEDKFGLKITAEEFGHFLGKAFTEWWKYRFTMPQVGPFREYYHGVSQNKFHSACVNIGDCAFRWIYIDPNGKVAHCSEGGDYGYPNYGNIKEAPLSYFYHHPMREQILARNYTLPKTECKNCRFWGLCHGGCAWNAYNRYNTFDKKVGCKSKRIFFEQYFEPVTGLKVNLHPSITYEFA